MGRRHLGRNLSCAHDEPFWSGPYVEERITSDKSYHRLRGAIENLYVVGPHDFARFHAIFVNPVRRDELDEVIVVNISRHQ